MSDNFKIIDSSPSIAEINAIITATNELGNAWVKLLPQVKAVTEEMAKGTPKEYSEALKQSVTLSKQLEKVSKDLTDAQVRLQKVEQEAAKTKQQLAKATYEEERAKAASLRTQSAEITLKQKIESLDKKEQQRLANAASLYSKLEQKLKMLQLEYRDLASAKELGIKLTDEEAKRMEFLQGKIKKYDTALKAVDASMGKHQRNVGDYARANNGLGMSLAQITREMPAFANSAQTGFMALSNNIPIFFDAIAQVKNLNKELQAQGKPTVSVLQQLAGAFLSWQTLLSVGVTLLTVYGADMWEWAKSTIFATESLKKASQDLNDVKKEANKNAAKEITDMEVLYRLMKDESIARKDRLDYAKKLQDLYPTIFGNMSTEKMLVGDTTKEYNALKDAIIATAMAEAIRNKISEATAKFLDKEEENLRKVGNAKIEVDKARGFKGDVRTRQVITPMGAFTETVPKEELVNNANNKLRIEREARQKDKNDYFSYVNNMLNILKGYEQKKKKIEDDGKGGTDKKDKPYTGAKLTGEQKDYLMTLMAQRDEELTIQKQLLYDKKINEEQYWVAYRNIFIKYRDAVDNYLKGKNAKEKVIDAATKKRALDEIIKSNEELFQLEKDKLDKIQKLNEEQSSVRLEKIKKDEFLTEVQIIDEQINAYNDLYTTTDAYYTNLITKAKENNLLQSELNKIELERQTKLTDISGNRDNLFSGYQGAYEKDANAQADFLKNIQGLTYEQQKQAILANKKLDANNRSYLLSKLENQNTINGNNLEIQRLENLKNQLSVRIAIARVSGTVNPKDLAKMAEYEKGIKAKQNENTNITQSDKQLDADKLKSDLSPLKGIINEGLSNIGLGSLSDEFDRLFNSIIDKAKGATDNFKEIWKEGFAIVGEYGKILVDEQLKRQLSALDQQLEASRNATEQELGFIDKRLEYFANMENMTKEQIAERNALEDEARTYREQQEQREKQIAAQKAKAEQRASANKALIGGLQGAATSIANLGLPAGLPFAIASVAMGAIMAGLIMSKNPIPQYFVGREGGRAEYALTQERGAEAIVDKKGRVKTWGNDKGAQLTWLDEGDSVLTASETLNLKRNSEPFQELDYNFYRNNAIKGIKAPIIINNADNSDAIAEKVGNKFDKIMSKYDKEHVFELNGMIYSQKGGQYPICIGRAKKSTINVNVNRNVRN